uniref:Uncharacterized protein n=1 Tax=Siphoviridae sp. ctOba29 TaxID=2825480 RepID=A0A8S5NYA1_9CAUD|nr:MAG TPA: hypothetical protein [Siphoviridae sp. ctOba29]
MNPAIIDRVADICLFRVLRPLYGIFLYGESLLYEHYKSPQRGAKGKAGGVFPGSLTYPQIIRADDSVYYTGAPQIEMKAAMALPTPAIAAIIDITKDHRTSVSVRLTRSNSSIAACPFSVRNQL